MTLDWRNGWLMVGADGRLYFVTYELDHWTAYADYRGVNGWQVQRVYPEWDRFEWPEWQE